MSDHVFAMPLIFAVTLAISFGLTALVRKVALQRGWVDMPGDARRVHSSPVPRLGGLAMFVAFAVGVLLTFIFDIRLGKSGNAAFEGSRVLLMLAGAGIITLVMAVDDLRGLRPVTRLIWQVGAALLVIVPSLLWPGGPNFIGSTSVMEPPDTRHYDQGAGVLALTVQSPFGGSIEMPVIVAVLFTIVWLVGMTNTINWIDGLDGLAAGVSVVACGVLFWITGPILEQWTLAYLPIILGAAILGFLPFNIHPARIFMGDSGAMFLGFTMAVIAIIGGAKLAAALLVLGVPILDGIYLVIYRLYRGRSPMSADRGHLHHRLLDLGFSQQQVVVIFYALSATFGVLGLLLPNGLLKLIALLIMAAILVGLLIYIARRKFDRVGAQK